MFSWLLCVAFFCTKAFIGTSILGVPSALAGVRAPTGLRRPPTGINGDNKKEYIENYDDHELSEEVSNKEEKFLTQVAYKKFESSY